MGRPRAGAKSVECGLCMLEIVSPVPGRVKPMAYQINTFCLLAWCPLLLGYGKGWLIQYNVTEWDIASWCQFPSEAAL